MEPSQLPRTFHDAADITRRLTYSYIWIDSLCIQQDSTDDWVDQAAKMTSIYMNADLTLAARWHVLSRPKHAKLPAMHPIHETTPDGMVRTHLAVP